MIASSSPNTKAAKAAKAPYANPSILPSGSIDDYRISTGPYAGMTYKEMLNYMRGFSQSVDKATNGDQPKNQQTQQALGLVGGIGGAAALNYGIRAAMAPSTTTALTQTTPVVTEALSQGGSQALATGGAQLGSQAASNSYQLAGTLGSQGAADLSAQGASAATGSLSGYVPFVGPAIAMGVHAYQDYKAAKAAYENGQGKSVGSALSSEAKSLKGGSDWKNRAAMAAFYASNPYGWYAYAASKLLGGTGGALFGSSKAPERNDRKEGRLTFQKAGLMGPDSRSIYNLADSSGYDIRTAPDHKAYNIDQSQEGAADKVGRLNALTAALIGSGKVKSDLTGELYNAYNSNGQFDQNFRSSADKVGGHNAIYQGIADRWKNDKNFTVNERDAAFAAIDKEYGIANPTNQRWDAGLSGKDAERNQKEFEKEAQKVVEEDKKNGVNSPILVSTPPQSLGALKPDATPIPKGGMSPQAFGAVKPGAKPVSKAPKKPVDSRLIKGKK